MHCPSQFSGPTGAATLPGVERRLSGESDSSGRPHRLSGVGARDVAKWITKGSIGFVVIGDAFMIVNRS